MDRRIHKTQTDRTLGYGTRKSRFQIWWSLLELRQPTLPLWTLLSSLIWKIRRLDKQSLMSLPVLTGIVLGLLSVLEIHVYPSAVTSHYLMPASPNIRALSARHDIMLSLQWVRTYQENESVARRHLLVFHLPITFNKEPLSFKYISVISFLFLISICQIIWMPFFPGEITHKLRERNWEKEMVGQSGEQENEELENNKCSLWKHTTLTLKEQSRL